MQQVPPKLAEPVGLYDELGNRKWIQGTAGSSMKGL